MIGSAGQRVIGPFSDWTFILPEAMASSSSKSARRLGEHRGRLTGLWIGRVRCKVTKFQSDPSEEFLVGEGMVEECLPVLDLAMLEDQFQGKVLEEEVFSGAEQGGETLLLSFSHGRGFVGEGRRDSSR